MSDHADSSLETNNPSQGGKRYSLLVLSGKREGLEIPVGADKCTIGRGGNCNLQLTSSNVSRYHCQIIIHKDQSVYVYDMKSANGTFVNNQRVKDRMKLQSGDVLTVASKALKFTEGTGPWKLQSGAEGGSVVELEVAPVDPQAEQEPLNSSEDPDSSNALIDFDEEHQAANPLAGLTEELEADDGLIDFDVEHELENALSADAADAIATSGTSVTINVLNGALEQAERAEGTDIGLRVLIGKRQAC
ncbi:MAG: FHA domain-containing protein, partial [Planctomycetales bacterium]